MDRGAARGRAPRAGTARRGSRDGTGPAPRGAAASRGRTGCHRPLAAPSPPLRRPFAPQAHPPRRCWPCLLCPCPPAAPGSLPSPVLSGAAEEGGGPYPPPRASGVCLVSVPAHGRCHTMFQAVRTQVGGWRWGRGEAVANPLSSGPRHA